MTDRISDYDYDLPPESIAQRPAERRDESRLFVYPRGTGETHHRLFRDLPDYLKAGDLLVRNVTRTRPMRLFLRKRSTGANIELLLLEPSDGREFSEALEWLALARPAKRLKRGDRLEWADGTACECVGEGEAGMRTVRFSSVNVRETVMEGAGEAPLPPYITERGQEPGRYDTVYARTDGSAAAPTAGFHFTPELLDRVRAMGVGVADVCLHVGLDTFRPVSADRLDAHRMHSERFEVPEETRLALEETRRGGGRVVAVGTTTVRALESAALGMGGRTDLFVRPGFRFRAVDALITNFHLPRSTLLVMVSAFAGVEAIRGAYAEAIRRKYRFYSFGDAMLIV